MLNLKPYSEVHADFLKEVEDRISKAQASRVDTVIYRTLPSSIRDELKELGYPVTISDSQYVITVL